MQFVFARSAWPSATRFGGVVAGALFFLLPGLSAAGLQHRPGRILCPPEEYLCPFGLGQWMAQQHRWIHGEAPTFEDAPQEPSPAHDALCAPPQSDPDADRECGCPYYGGKNYRDFEGCGDYRGYENDDSSASDGKAEVSLAEALADSRHGMGQRFAQHLNTVNDGLDDEADAEVEWHEPFLPTEAEMPTDGNGEGPGVVEGLENGDSEGEQDTRGQEPGFFERMRLRINAVVDEAATVVADTLRRMADEEVEESAAAQPWYVPLPEQPLEPRDLIPPYGAPYEAETDF
jgi:hypothetical protein